MKNTFKIQNEIGREFNVKILWKGDAYGRDKCLTHDEVEPLVEFYDATYSEENGDTRFDPEGQFVSRYYAETILERDDCGLDLMGYEPAWKVDYKAMRKVRAWLTDAVLAGPHCDDADPADLEKIIPWTGYMEGAIKADAEGITRVARDPDGNLHVWMDGETYNVHPKVTACGWNDDDRCEYAGGVYPIRWKV